MKYSMIVLSVILVFLSGCAASNRYDPNTYSGQEVNSIGGYETGVVKSVRSVTIQDDTTGVGAASGGALGAVAGSNVGGGTGRIVGGILGALTFGIIGNTVEQNTSAKTDAQEITVELSYGREFVFVQEDTQNLKVGDKVKFIAINGDFRVVKY